MTRWQFGPRGSLTHLRRDFRKSGKRNFTPPIYSKRYFKKAGLGRIVKLYGMAVERHTNRLVKVVLPESLSTDRATRFAEHILRWHAKKPLRRVAVKILRSDRSRNRFGF
jgi:hypothetical protein